VCVCVLFVCVNHSFAFLEVAPSALPQPPSCTHASSTILSSMLHQRPLAALHPCHRCAQELFSIRLRPHHLIELDSSGPLKWSRHLVVRMRTAFANNGHCNAFVRALVARLQQRRQEEQQEQQRQQRQQQQQQQQQQQHQQPCFSDMWVLKSVGCGSSNAAAAAAAAAASATATPEAETSDAGAATGPRAGVPGGSSAPQVQETLFVDLGVYTRNRCVHGQVVAAYRLVALHGLQQVCVSMEQDGGGVRCDAAAADHAATLLTLIANTTRLNTRVGLSASTAPASWASPYGCCQRIDFPLRRSARRPAALKEGSPHKPWHPQEEQGHQGQQRLTEM